MGGSSAVHEHAEAWIGIEEVRDVIEEGTDGFCLEEEKLRIDDSGDETVRKRGQERWEGREFLSHVGAGDGVLQFDDEVGRRLLRAEVNHDDGPGRPNAVIFFING